MEAFQQLHGESGVSLVESILQMCGGKWESLHRGRYHYTLIDAQCDKDILKRITALNNDVWEIVNVEYINTSLIFNIKDKRYRRQSEIFFNV